MLTRKKLHEAVSHGLMLQIAMDFIEVDDMCVAIGDAARIRTANWAPASDEKVVSRQRDFIWKLIEIASVLRGYVGNKKSVEYLNSLHSKLFDLHDLLESFPYIGERGTAARLAWQEARELFRTKIGPYTSSFLEADPAIRIQDLLQLVHSHFHREVKELFEKLESADTRIFIDRLKQADCVAVLKELEARRRSKATEYFKLLIENEGKPVEKRAFIERCHGGKPAKDEGRERKQIAEVNNVALKHSFCLTPVTVQQLKALGQRTELGTSLQSVGGWKIVGEELRRLLGE